MLPTHVKQLLLINYILLFAMLASLIVTLTTNDPTVGKYSEGGFIVSAILLAYIAWRLCEVKTGFIRVIVMWI